MPAVHPHAGGENALEHKVSQINNRFTPTRVGKTTDDATMAWTPTVHPHAGGENGWLRDT